jgi:serine/threonine protein kinase
MAMNDERQRREGDLQDLDRIVVDCLAAVEDTGPDAIEEFCREHPRHAAALRRRLDLLLGTGLLDPLGDDGRPEDEPVLPERLGEYRVVGRLGGGGMGVVYRAIQDGLDREVAIKTIRPELLHFGDARARFRREVSTVAKLSHPGIVPVYGSGEHEGVPWFAMEHVVGASLGRVLAEIPRGDPSRLSGQDLRAALARAAGRDDIGDSELFAGTWIESALLLGREIAAALDHAHRARVLHRDVKPSNILLGLDGRPRLFDFGLARAADEAGDVAVTELTRTGAMVGSLPYMAPEQVRGEAVDRRTDVYGLAATLIEFLTLEPPYTERTTEALRAAILAAQPLRLPRRNRALPRDLVVVLGKALDADPARRYATPGDFARDLDAVLELRPITARPTGVSLQVQRWARRRPAAAVAIAFAVVALIATPVVLAVVNARITAALDVAEAQRAQAEVQRARAEARFTDAYDAIVGLAAVVGDESLRDVPGAGPVRREVLERSAALFERLVADRPDDVAVRLQHGRLLRQTASVLDELGARDEAAAMRGQAEGLFRDRLAERPADAVAALELADLLVDRSAAGTEAVLPVLDEAERLLAVAAADPSAVPAHQVLAALRQVLHNRANTLRGLRREEDAVVEAERAIAVAERLLDESPAGDPAARLALGASRSLRSLLHHDADEVDAAAEQAGAAERILTALVDDDPRPLHRHRLGMLLGNESVRAYREARYDEAERLGRRSAEIYAALVGEQPYVATYRRRLAAAHEAIGLSFVGRESIEAAVHYFAENAASLDALVELDPSPGTALRRAMAHHNLANAHVDLGDRLAAVPHASTARAEFDRLGETYGHRESIELSALARFIEARARLAVGEVPDAALLERILRERAENDDNAWFEFAVCLADVATAEATARSGRRGEFADAAIGALREAIDRGFDRSSELDSSAPLAALSTREDFARLRARMTR